MQEASLPAKGLDSEKNAPDRDDENESAAASSPMTGPPSPAGPKALSLALSDASHSSDEELLAFDFRRTGPKKLRKHSDADITMGTRLKMDSDAAASVEKELKADLDAAAATEKKACERDTLLACGLKDNDLIGRESKLEEEELAVGQPVGGALLKCVTLGGSVKGLSVKGDEAERGKSEAKPKRKGDNSRGTVLLDSVQESLNGSARASDSGKRSSDSDMRDLNSCAMGSDSGTKSLDASGASKSTGAVSIEVASETRCGEDAGRPLLKRVKQSVDDLLKLKYTAGGVRKEKQAQGAVTRKLKDGEEAAQGGSQKKEVDGKITGAAQTGGNGNGRTGGAKTGLRTGNGRREKVKKEKTVVDRLEIVQKKTAAVERAELLKNETVETKKKETRGGVKVSAEVGKKGSAVGLTERGGHDVREEGEEGDTDDELFAAISYFKNRRGTESSGVKSGQTDSSGIVQRNQSGGKVQDLEEAGTELEDMKDGWDAEKSAKELEERKGGGKHLLGISKQDESGLAMGTAAKGKGVEKAAGVVSKSGLQIERVTSEGTRRSKRVSRGKDMLSGWKRALKDVQ